MIENPSNWAGNYTYRAARFHQPETVEQVQEMVIRTSKLKALGTRHSFNDIADLPGDLISLEHFDQIVALDRERRTVTWRPASVMDSSPAGFTAKAMRCITWLRYRIFRSRAPARRRRTARAIATETWPRRYRPWKWLQAMASWLSYLVEQDGEQFQGAVVGLGGLGVITKLTLDISPTFEMRQDVYENLPLAELEEHFDELFSSVYSVSLFTDWRNATFNQVWLKRHVPDNASIRVWIPIIRGDACQQVLSIRLQRSQPKIAQSRWACAVPGMSACLTSAWTSHPAAARSCRVNIWCRASTRSRRSAPSINYGNILLRFFRFRRFAVSPPMTFG